MAVMKVRDGKPRSLGWGAGWGGGLSAGPFCWGLYDASSNRNRNISSQLVNALKHPVRNGGVLL